MSSAAEAAEYGPLLVVAGALLAIVAWVVDRRRRAYLDQPTTLAAAVFAGRNEVKGRAWAPAPVLSHRTKTACVWWEYVLEEERRHTRTTTDHDGKGTRTETYKEWHVVDEKDGALDGFEVVDASGSVPVVLRGARVEPRSVHEEVFREGDRGFFESLFDNRTGRYREKERAVAIGDQLFVVGDARLDEATSVPVLHDALVSTRDEASRTSMLGFAVAALAILAVAATTVGGAMLLSPDDPGRPLAVLPGLVASAVVFVVAWTVRIHNRLRVVAQGVERARSLVDVQLQRRHDLVPALVSVVKAHAAHEQAIVALATRSRGAPAGSVDAARDTADLRTIFTVAEAHPELTADAAFVRLRDEVADCEARIAASRTFQNDCRTLLHDRSRQFPDALVARRLSLGLDRADGRGIDGFERTAPAVDRAFADDR